LRKRFAFVAGNDVESKMSEKSSKPIPRFTVITLGVTDMRASIAFYEALGFAKKCRQPARRLLSSTPAAP
jgi:hypothetical protein